jgi:hypothetical protein
MRKRWNGLLVALSLVAVQVVVAPQASGTTIPPGSVHVESKQSNVDITTSKAARANHSTRGWCSARAAARQWVRRAGGQSSWPGDGGG